jgi:hypothetical protein
MRLSEDRVKQAILHPEEEARLTALRYVSDSGSRDESVMPLVIRAVELHGRERAFRLLRIAEHLPQTEPTVTWLMDELRHEFDQSDVGQDNYRFAISLILREANPVLIGRQCQAILSLPAFPDELRASLEERVEMAVLDWPARWQAFTRFAHELNERPRLTSQDFRRLDRFVRLLGWDSEAGTGHVLHLLDSPDAIDEELGDWLEPWIARLAGVMRLQGAIPHLIDRALSRDDDEVVDECGPALGRIGGDALVQAITDVWPEADEEFRNVVCEALEYIHTDLSTQTCLDFLREEEDDNVALSLGHALLSHFAIEAVEPVRQLVLDENDLDPDQSDLRDHLLAACVIMNTTFPEFEAWHAEAVRTNWGWGDHRPERLADSFRDDGRGPTGDDDWPADERRLDPDAPCPCGSGQAYGECCWKKDFDWVVAEDGTVQRMLSMPGELFEMLQVQRRAFIEEHGREPGPDDLVFPNLPHPEHLEHHLVLAMQAAGVDPAVIFAFEQTGFLVTEENEGRIPSVDLEAWDAAIEEYHRRQGRAE